jgi:hypothetical protein
VKTDALFTKPSNWTVKTSSLAATWRISPACAGNASPKAPANIAEVIIGVVWRKVRREVQKFIVAKTGTPSS